MKINVIKGTYNKTSISNTVFKLKQPIVERHGVITAIVDGSDLFGKDFSTIKLEVKDYKLIT